MKKKNNLSELTALGTKFYEEKLKPLLEPDHKGEFIAIEPYLEKYEIDKDEVQVMLKARREMPDSKFYFRRIGFELLTKSEAHGSGNRCSKCKFRCGRNCRISKRLSN